ncbi:MAG: hypothetical protein GXX85_16900 [Ignavibacteria bacterium]|nr:hypothetical protein [Ignavibacteria bacterium]
MKINENMKMFLQTEKLIPGSNKQIKTSEKKDKIEISNTSKVFERVNDFLNLGKPNRLDTSDLSPEEKEEYVKMIAALIQKGVIGYEIREVNGKPEKHYIVNQIGNQRLYGTKLYNRPGYYDR